MFKAPWWASAGGCGKLVESDAHARMKILSIVSTSGLNGAVVYAREANKLLAARGHKILLACLPQSPLALEMHAQAPPGITVVPTSLKWRSLAEVRRVAQICRAENVQVVHSHMTRASNFAAALHLLHGFPSVVHVHSNHFQFHYWCHDLLIAVSADTQRRHRWRLAGLGRGSVLLPNFVDTARFRPGEGRTDGLRPLLGVAAGTAVVVQVGNLERRKGQDLTRAAAELVWHTHPQTHFAFLGHWGPPADWSADTRVHWLGVRSDVADLLPHATVSVLPSRDDPFPLAALESMAAGVPLVAAAVGGLTEMGAGGCALMIPPNDAAALASAIRSTFSDAPGTAARVAAGLNRVRTAFAPEAHVLNLERHLQAVVAARHERATK